MSEPQVQIRDLNIEVAPILATTCPKLNEHCLNSTDSTNDYNAKSWWCSI